MRRSIPIAATTTLIAITLVTAGFIKSHPGDRPTIQEKVRSFSCAQGGAFGDLQLAWTDDQPNPDKTEFTEGKFGIYLKVAPPHELPPRDALVSVETSPKLTISVDGHFLKVNRVWVSDPATQDKYRDANAEELSFLSEGAKRNLTSCFYKSYEFIGLNDEL